MIDVCFLYIHGLKFLGGADKNALLGGKLTEVKYSPQKRFTTAT